MKKTFIVLALICANIFSVSAEIPSNPQFSADMIMTHKGKQTSSGKVFMGTQAMRMEIDMDGKPQVQIMRFDKDIMWSVMKDEGMYMQMPLKFNALANYKMEGQKENCATVETIDGHPTQRCEVEGKFGGKKVKSVVWKATDLQNIGIKTSDEKGANITELKNIKKGPQPTSLFAEPTGLKKMDMKKGLGDLLKGLG